MMAESKRELPDTSHEHLQDDGEIPRKKKKTLNDKDAAEPLCVPGQSNDEDSSKTQNLSDDSEIMCIVCDPCGEDGKSLKAEGYCVDCNDFLCIHCFRIHIKPKPLRHHVLQDKNSMPHSKSTTTKERQKEPHCLTHQGQTVLSYCTTHDSVLCNVCQQFDHRRCQKHGNLIDLNEVVLDTNQLTDVQCQIEALKEELENNTTISTQTDDNIRVSYARVVKEITEIKDSDLKMTKDISATCENMLLDVVSMGEDLKSLSATQDKLQLFLKLKKAQTLVKKFECKLIQVRNDNKNFQYMFISADQINKNYGKFGSLVKCPIETETISIKSDTDETDCSITGIARLSEDKYVIADYNNKKVKLVDLTSKTVTSDFKLDMAPYDVTNIDENKIATLGSHTIILISISDTMRVYNTINVDYGRGITRINDNLVLRCGFPNRIQVRTLDGDLKHTVNEKDKDGIARFGEVHYISHGVDLNILYLTDVTSNKIIRMTLDWDVLASFTHKYLISPRGITCSRDGRIFVCSLDSHMIFEITLDLSQGKIILGKENGIFKPSSIFFSEEKQQLLVGSLDKNTIQMFQM